MKHKLIAWMGVSYKAVELTVFPGTSLEEDVTVSVEALYDQLLDAIRNGVYEADTLDEKIAYYLTSDEIKLSEDEIREIVESALI